MLLQLMLSLTLMVEIAEGRQVRVGIGREIKMAGNQEPRMMIVGRAQVLCKFQSAILLQM